MALIYVITRFILLSTIIFISGKLNPTKGIVQQEIGPRNITRVEGETYVYILCPFDESYSFKWKINNVDYEATSLPEGMIPATYGILIIEVQQSMNNTTFQCWVPTGAAYGIRESSVGTLAVIESGDNISSDPQLEFGINVVPQINLDHQRIFFLEDRKTFAWNSDACDNTFQINASICIGSVLRSWQTHETEITIPSTDLTFESDIIDQTFFKLDAFDDEQQICRELPEQLVVNTNDITEEIAVPLNGQCFDISSLTVPNVVLPKNHSTDLQGQDCICSILINKPCYDFSSCSCINETIFSKTIVSCKLQTQLSPVYHLCFLNLTTDMNNTIIHIFESYRFCTSSENRHLFRFYWEYHKSFRLITALPNPPDIAINYETGEIEFSSEDNDGIPIDYFQVIISDITQNILYNNSHTQSDNIITSISGIFPGSACLPYNVTVQAHNSFGFSHNNVIVSKSSDPNGGCLCINQNVFTEMTLLEETGGVLLQVNCSQTRYSNSSIMLKVSAEQDGETVQNMTSTCKNQDYILFDSLQCDLLYTFVIYWIPDQEKMTDDCIIDQVGQMLQCPGTTLEDRISLSITISIISSLLLCFVFVFCIYMYLKFCRRTKSLHSIQFEND